MDKKQWKTLLGVFGGLAITTVLIVVLTVYMDVNKDVVNEGKKETQKIEKEVKKETTEILGAENELLTWSEMVVVVDSIKEDLGEDENITDIADVLEEKYGIFNRLAYELDYVIENVEDKDVKNSVTTSLIYSYLMDDNATVAGVENVNALDSYSTFIYQNAVSDMAKENQNKRTKRPVADVVGVNNLLLTDTKGFHKGDLMHVGYPKVDAVPYYLDSSQGDKYGVEVSFYVEKDTKLKDFIKDLQKVDVSIGDYKAGLIYQDNFDAYVDSIWGIYNDIMDIEGKGRAAVSDVEKEQFRKLLEERKDLIPIKYSVDRHLGVLYEEYGVEATDLAELVNFYNNNQKEYVKYLDVIRDKVILGGTFINVAFEIDSKAIVGDLNIYNDDPEEYYENKDNKPPIITVDGVDMQLAVGTKEMIEEKGIYYQY